jgi:cobalt-zinc-cadmium efflux system membrane fusion protein
MGKHPLQASYLLRDVRGRITAASLAVIAVVAVWFTYAGDSGPPDFDSEFSSQAKVARGVSHSAEARRAGLTIEMVQEREFRSEFETEGKIGVDEDHSTPIFSPYAGRVMKLFAKPGDLVEIGQPLFTVEATDMVQAQNDFITAVTALNKARSALNLAQITDKRQRLLYEAKAVPLKEVQNARAALDAAENDVRSGEVALEAAHNRLHILGKTDGEIDAFQQTGAIDPATPIYAPIGGTVVQRKVGPGQYIGNSASDPVFVIGDLSTVWLNVQVREWDAPKVSVGQRIRFTVLAEPEHTYEANLNYTAAILDANTRRLFVRATIDNFEERLMPEMFANVRIAAGEITMAPAVPRYAVMYENENAHVWVAHDDRTIELRPIKTGWTNGSMIQVVEGLKLGEKLVTKGSLFIDRVASGG